MIYHYTDWTGERKQSQKRGFKTKREALAWEREQLNKATANLDMTFASFVEQYTADMKTRIKENTWATKEHIIRTKLLPYFGKLKMCNITAQQIITWQNEMLDHKDENGKKYSPAYLRSVNNQLSAIFNHAVRYYDLRENPCKKAGSMGKKKNRKMLFWTKEEYLKFAEVMMDKPLSFYAFEMLYWCGIREGELLALTPADFDFEKCTVSITKSYQRLNGQDLITTPKTEKSNRVIKMPQFLADEMLEYNGMLGASPEADKFDMVIGNPAYMKIAKNAPEATTMPDVCYGAPNLYFLFAAMSMFDLKAGGEMVYIIPRSWTSGTYFKQFRKRFFEESALEHIHLFVSRDKVFEKESVLQETIIIKAKKMQSKPNTITITTTQSNADFSNRTVFEAPYSTVVNGDESYVYLMTNTEKVQTLNELNRWTDTLPDIGLKRKTGLTVDFRNREALR